MTARRDSFDEPAHGSPGGRALLLGAVALAIVATAVLVLSDDLKYMRLGIVAGLWAALAGAFIAARYRRQVTEREEEAAERQERYEFELEREVAARREHELEVEADARRRAEADASDHIAALRAELHGLRQTLQTLMGGEFLVERYALRAESTRMRSLPEDHPLNQEFNQPRRLLPAQRIDGGDAVATAAEEAATDLIDRVPGSGDALPRRADRSAEQAKARFQQFRAEPEPHPAEMSDQWFMPDALEQEESDWGPSWESKRNGTSRPNGRSPNGHPPNGRSVNGHSSATNGRSQPSGYATPRPTAAKPSTTSGNHHAAASSGRIPPARSTTNGAPPADPSRSASRVTPAAASSGRMSPAAASAARMTPATAADRMSQAAVGDRRPPRQAISERLSPSGPTASSTAMPPAGPAASSARMSPAGPAASPANSGRMSSAGATASSGGMSPASRGNSGRISPGNSGRMASPAASSSRVSPVNPAASSSRMPSVGGASPVAPGGVNPAASPGRVNPAASSSRMPTASQPAGRTAGPAASSSGMPPAAPIAPSYTPPVSPAAANAYGGTNGTASRGPAEPGQRTVDTGGFPTQGGRRAAESGYVAPVAFGPGAGGPTDRRSVESGYMAPVARGSRHNAEEPAGGRRHRAEGQPSWQESANWQQNGSRSGSHARPDTDMPSGSHATGRSVSDLLASNGGATNTPHRRRRRED